MAADKSGQPTFPVWVGSLKDTVTGGELRKCFSRYGPISSVKLMRDGKTGKSKGFGWVNFYSRTAAENAAAKMAGSLVHGIVIKTSGPAELERKGLFSPIKRDFRPLTDCSFFIQGNHCKKGDTCEYRHSVQALSTEAVCPGWQKKQCTNQRCPMRHPGSRESPRKSTSSSGSPPPEAGGGAGGGMQVCGGRCGDLSCSLSFSSMRTLSQHIQHGQLQCTTCKIVFGSQAELHKHRKVCSRSHNDSSSTNTSLSDVEVLSDSESVTSDDSNYPLKHGSIPAPVETNVRVPGGGGAKKRRQKKKTGVSGSSANVAQTVMPKKSKVRKASSEATLSTSPDVHKAPYLLATHDGGGELGSESVSFNVGSDSSESSDEDDLMYTSAEMAQLLSLNEQDMHPCTGSSDSEDGEGEGEGEGGDVDDDEVKEDSYVVFEGREVGEEGRKAGRKKRRLPRTRRKEAHSGSSDTAPVTHDSNPNPRLSSPHQSSHRPTAHSRQPEPVGLFWDIENCSVPVNKSAFGVAAKMRRVFFEGKREAEFMVVCDITKERKEITDALNKAQVTLVHVNAVAKNAADDKLRQSLRRFAHTYPAPSTVVLVSSDVNFSSELNDLRHVHNLTIVLVHNHFTSDALKVFAHQLVEYEQFLEDVEAPKQAQRPPLPNILLVSNLPKNLHPKKLSSRLGQLSDNCGGRVLGVDPTSGTARILFRSPEWAMKAEKRMKGEDVFGSKITLCLDYSAPMQQPQQPHRHQPPPAHHPPPSRPLFSPPSSHDFHRLSGEALGRTFPPAAHPPTNHPPMQPSPPPLRSSHPFGPPLPPRTNAFLPLVPPRGPPPNIRFPHPPPPCSPKFPPSPPQRPLLPGHPPYSHIAAIPSPRPEGKILIFKIPAPVEVNSFEELDRQVLTIVLEACIKTETKRQVMWHSYSEMQVLLRLDFHQTAVVKKDELIRRLWEKGDLKANVAEKFVEQCVKSLGDLCRRKGLTWQVTSCGWSEDEESDRVTRSQVIDLLRRYPLFWVNWKSFKKKYNKIYHCALSEMAVHTSCKGAVMILGKPDNNESQVIIRYEMSPLVRISSQKKVYDAVLKKVIAMLSSRPEQRLKLLDVVRELTNEAGPLPLSASGRPLQEVLSSSPQLQFVGSKPSCIYLTLVNTHTPAPEKKVAPPTPQKNTAGDLETLAAEFRHLLKKQTPICQLPLSRLQQEYQTLYHHSFRVSDYVPTGEGSKMKRLVEACAGLKVKDVRQPDNRVETIVFLESEANDAINEQAHSLPKQQPTDSLADCECRVRDLLCGLPNYQITLDRFMSEYEKMYGSKMSYYGHLKLSNLLESFPSTLNLIKGPNRLVQLQPIHILTHEITLLLSAHNDQLSINQIVPEYKVMFGKNLVPTQFGFPKLIRVLEAIPDTIRLVGKGASRVAVLKKPIAVPTLNSQLFGDEITALLMSTHNSRQSVIELTKAYNDVFRNPTNKSSTGKLPPISPAEMVEILRKMPGFSISGAGPVQYVSMVRQNEKEKKEKTKASQKLPSETLPAEPVPLPNHESTQQVSTDFADSAKKKDSSQLHVQPPPPSKPTAVPVSLSDGGSVGVGSIVLDAVGGESSVLHLDDKESQRLASETQRLLQCHREHAMTVSELVQSFKEAEDPAGPQPEELYLCLLKHNVKKSGSKSPKTFQISAIPGSVGDTMIQLNRADCHGKLAFDLLYLFVHQPTPRLTLSLTHVGILYQQCHGHKLIPAVYGIKTLQGVIETAKPVSQLMKLDETKQFCSLTEVGCRRVMSSLLVELLFLRGEECLNTTVDLPRLFQQHFGFPLPLALLRVNSPSALLALPEIHNCIQVTDGRPELKVVNRFAEQLRFLLTQNNGRLPLDSLQGLYISAFGTSPDTHGKDWLDTKLIHYAPHVVNLAGHKWAVWAPAGRPYPVRNGNKPSPPSPHPVPLQLAGAQHEGPKVHATTSAEDLLEMEEGVGRVREHGVELEISEEVGQGEVGCHVEETPSMMPQSLPGKTHIQCTSPSLMFDGATHHETTVDETVTATPGCVHNLLEMQPSEKIADQTPPLFNSSSQPQQNVLRDSQLLLTARDNEVHVHVRQSAAHSASKSEPQSTLSEEQTTAEYDESPYGFLQKDPELLAQFTIKEEDVDTALSTADALQQLIAAGSTAHDFDIPDLPPPIFPLSSQDDESTRKLANVPLDGTADYLQAGLKPDEVLQELYRVKDSGGGIIDPASMEPFLSYFGELSSRELERLESQQEKPKTPTPSPTPTKGMLRKKRMMAIRFPGQTQDDIDPELQKTLESIQLPEISSLSDDSDDSDTCPRPVTRAELLEKLMDKDYFFGHEEEKKDSDRVVSGSGDEGFFLPPNGVASSLVPESFSESGRLSELPYLPHYYEQGKSGQQ